MEGREDDDELNAQEEEDTVFRELQESVESCPDDPVSHFNIALFLWKKDNESKQFKEKAAEHFLLSAKLNPQNGSAFRYLGHFYSRVSFDSQRALKCYQRAVSLSPDDYESGEALCDLLDEEGKENLEAAICREACDRSPRAFWAFRRLGYLLVHQKKWSEAVQSLQHGIRGYPACADLWEALGLAYQKLGMFTAAVKSYGRVIELESSRVFSLVESGNIFVMLGSFRKAIEQFQQALNLSPHNVSANYGLASSLLALVKECLSLGASIWGASLLEEASKAANTCCVLAGNFFCVWKLLGDTQLAYAKCLPWKVDDRGFEIDDEAFRTSVLSWKTVRCSAAFSACQSYKRALHLAPWEANIYMDIAIASHLAYSLKDKSEQDQNAWQLSEKMSCGSLLLEGDNHEFWVTLGCISDNTSLKQHAFIRGLQLDVSLAVSWAFLGKLYGDEDKNELAKRAFDHARSIDPSLALPWASMSTHIFDSESKPIDAYENCLQAVQILPLADFQIGLAKLALTSGHLSSPKVFGAVHQAVQHAPFYPECHNISGLVYEAWSDFDSAALAYRLARLANESFAGNVSNPHLRYISSNLARVLCKAGKALDAVQECEDLKIRGWLDTECLHIYALSLWQLGKKDLVLSVVRDLASRASSVGQASKAASISLVCRLLYYTVGLESAITYIVKMPKELFQSSKISFVVSAMHALGQSNELESVVSASRSSVTAYEDITGMHYLISLSKLIKLGYDGCLGIQSGIKHLRKLIHVYPNCTLFRNLLGYLLLLSEEGKHIPASGRCLVLSNNSSHTENEVLKTAYDILGALTVACCCTASKVEEKFSFSACECHSQHGSRTLMQLQKWVRQEPWNNNASYLLIMNYMQKAREKRYPKYMCDLLGRLIDASLSNYQDTKLDKYCLYKRFLLLLCASEIRLQVGDHVGCINHANTASRLQLPDNYLFFAHLILCRAYAIAEDFDNLQREYTKCLELETDHQVGWICLKFIETRYNLNCGQDILQLSLEKCPKQINDTQNMWVPIHNLVRGLISVSRNDFVLAENFLSQASSVADKESCILLCHGAICLELAKELGDSQFLTIAIRSLKKAKVASSSSAQLPIVCLLLAQAEGSHGSKAKWEQNLMYEWLAWPPGKRPAELHLQMYLLSMHSDNGLRFSSHVEGQKHPQSWILSSIHLNPSCLRYWKVLQNSR